MGQQQSAHSELEKGLEKLSDTERQELLALFRIGKEGDGPTSDGFFYKILEVSADCFLTVPVGWSILHDIL